MDVTGPASGTGYDPQRLPPAADCPGPGPAGTTALEDRARMLQRLGIALPVLPPCRLDPNRPPGTRPVRETDPEDAWTDQAGRLYFRSAFGWWNQYAPDVMDDPARPEPAGNPVQAAAQDSAGCQDPVGLLASLPDPLLLASGTRVHDQVTWDGQGRPAVLAAACDCLWGRPPPGIERLVPHWTISEHQGQQDGLPFVQLELEGRLDTTDYPELRGIPRLLATLRLPSRPDGPRPVLILPGQGNRTPVDLYARYCLKAGWGVCVLDVPALQPDRGDGLTSHLIGYLNRGAWRRPGDWGSLGAWAWGVSRVLDRLLEDRRVDGRRIGVAGHSRFGKAALAAMALDTRLAILFASCSGSLGAKLGRWHDGQDLEHSAGEQEYHWLCGQAFAWMGPVRPGQYRPRRVSLMPVDAHSLLALCAPRPVFLGAGTTDAWSSWRGSWLAARAASPVWEVLGQPGLVAAGDWPVPDHSLAAGRIGFRLHSGGHSDTPDWPAFLDFARAQLGG